MKKAISLVCILLVCATLLGSCNVPPAEAQIDMNTPPTTAEMAMAYMDAQMADLQSYRADVTMDFVLYSDGNKVRSELTSIVIEDAGKRIGDYYSYTEIRNTMYFGNNGARKVQVNSIDAYADGVAYQSYTQDKRSRKICSKMRTKDFLKYREGDSDIIDFSYADCENKTFEATDKGYVISCSGYSAQAMRAMTVATGIAEINDDTLQDMQVTIKIGKDYLPTKIALETIIHTDNYYNDTQPYFRMVIDFSEYNAAEHIMRTIEPEDYTMIKDLKQVDELDDMIAKTLDQKESGFTREVTHNVTFQEQTNTTSQIDVTASFTNDKKEGFSFRAELEDGRHGTKVTYANGDMIGLPSPDGSKINRISDAEAKQELLSLINDPSIGYYYTRVLNIEKTKTGYLVTMIPSPYSVVEQLGNSLGVNLSQENETIEFVIKRGKLVKLIHSFGGHGKISGEDLQYTGSITVTFD